MNPWLSLAGLLELELLTADPSGALDAMTDAGVELTRISQENPLTLRFRIRRKAYSTAAALADRRGERLRILKRKGLYWHLRHLASRPILLAGLALLLTLILLVPNRIFFFRVQGNTSIPTKEILAAAEESGLSFGVRRRSIRSEQIKNALLSAIPELKWAGVNTAGCVATISVAEKPAPTPMEPESSQISSLVASRDGILASLTATCGTPICVPGQAVQKGQVLISGFTDCGLTVLAQRAQGEIMAYTSRVFTAVAPEQQLIKGEGGKIIRRWSLIFGKKRIKLWFGSGISDGECGRMYAEYPLTLPGGFVLPVRLALDAWEQSFCTPQTLPQADAEAQLTAFAENYLRQTMVAGTIQVKRETVALRQSAYVLSGRYSCLESIGVRRPEQIGETNEQGS